PDQASNLLIDDTTYFAFMESRLPQHQLAVLAPKLHGSISDPLAYLRSRHSSGIILGCQWLPRELRHRAHMRGSFCCLAPRDWDAPSTSAQATPPARATGTAASAN
ncbi:MAG TPA: hypothetical protein VN222_14625, partial [Novosphingobium sp.]|nr:hypothetical protein [Novosphingobium sp.]